jgi:hypothetical protein
MGSSAVEDVGRIYPAALKDNRTMVDLSITAGTVGMVRVASCYELLRVRTYRAGSRLVSEKDSH